MAEPVPGVDKPTAVPDVVSPEGPALQGVADQVGAPAGADQDGSDPGLIDRVEDLVDDILATDYAPPEPEDPWERRQRLLDSWTAILLAVAAVATTWASFQASQWSGEQSDAQSASAMQRSDAGRAQAEAGSQEVVDSQMWLSWLNAYANGQAAREAFFAQRFSPQLARAQEAWLGSVPRNEKGQPTEIPKGTPLDLPSYIVPQAVLAQDLADRAEENLAIADQAAGNSTQFVSLAVLFALSLFFASVATKFSSPKLQVLLVLVGLVMLVVGIIRMVLAPQML